MASGYTSNYSLCQWQGEDKFLREEFNQDNEKLDAALKALSQGAEGLEAALSQGLEALETAGEEALEPIRYNLYQLWLQRYYEGKETGTKKALIFDGFLDGGSVAQQTKGLFLHSGALRLFKAAQGDVTGTTRTGGVTVSNESVTTDTFTAEGCGYVEHCTLTANYLGGTSGSTLTATVEFQVNGTVLSQSQETFRMGDETFVLTPADDVPVCPGDTFRVVLTAPENDWLRLKPSGQSSSRMAADFTFQSGAADTGTMTSTAFPLQESCEGARLYVRRRNGSVTPRLNGKTLTFDAGRDTVDASGSACREESWYLNSPLQGTLTVALELNRNSADEMEVLDYGVILS